MAGPGFHPTPILPAAPAGDTNQPAPSAPCAGAPALLPRPGRTAPLGPLHRPRLC